jgi:Cd2+/Zn2+-exporting ATPase
VLTSLDEVKLKLDIPLLIPGLTNREDGCLEKLESALQNQRGVQRAHVDRDHDPMTLCLHYNPELVTIDDVRRTAQRAGAGIANRYHHEIIPVEDIDCSDCAVVLSHGLGRTAGVLDARVSYAAQTVHVEYDATIVNRATLEKRISQLGYHVPSHGARKWYAENHELLLSLLAGSLLTCGWLLEQLLGAAYPLSLALYLGAYLAGGWHVARHTWHALRERQFDTDLLMLAAALGAAALGEYAEGALLLTLFSLGHALENRAMRRARSAIRGLADLAPKTALVRREGQELTLPVEQVSLGDVVILPPGARLPVDGTVLAGRSGVDQSAVTGESLPVEKAPGDAVYAGSINGAGALEIQASRLARDSTLSRIIELVEQAQVQKSPTQLSTERFMRWFVPLVLAADLMLIVVPPLFGMPFEESFLRAMTLLVAASPCALALGTPSAVLAGIARAARGGVLFKGGMHLENLGRVRAVAFDKTGTLTEGKPSLTGSIPVDGISEKELLALAAAVESRSAHPLAYAIEQAARTRQLSLPAVSSVQSVDGRGLLADIEGEMLRVGSLKWVAESGETIPAEIGAQAEVWEDQGASVVAVSRSGALLGILAVADRLRPEAPQVIAALRAMGIEKTLLLTGDNQRTARYIAAQAGISDPMAELMPEDKLRVIGELVKNSGTAAMVGDGVNDAPALAHASVGIAMGAAGTPAALEAADVALMADDLTNLPSAIGLGRAAGAVIRQNLAIALAVIAGLVAASITGWVGIGLAIALHEGSTLLVVLNSLRLLDYQYKLPPPHEQVFTLIK